jgi:hypothetical protein
MEACPLDAGEWSRAYALVPDGREAFIRCGDHVEDFRKDQVMASRSPAALPIPAVIEISAAGEAYFAVSERAPGELLDGLGGARMRAVLPGLLAVPGARTSHHPVTVRNLTEGAVSVSALGSAYWTDGFQERPWLTVHPCFYLDFQHLCGHVSQDHPVHIPWDRT